MLLLSIRPVSYGWRRSGQVATHIPFTLAHTYKGNVVSFKDSDTEEKTGRMRLKSWASRLEWGGWTGSERQQLLGLLEVKPAGWDGLAMQRVWIETGTKAKEKICGRRERWHEVIWNDRIGCRDGRGGEEEKTSKTRMFWTVREGKKPCRRTCKLHTPLETRTRWPTCHAGCVCKKNYIYPNSPKSQQKVHQQQGLCMSYECSAGHQGCWYRRRCGPPPGGLRAAGLDEATTGKSVLAAPGTTEEHSEACSHSAAAAHTFSCSLTCHYHIHLCKLLRLVGALKCHLTLGPFDL